MSIIIPSNSIVSGGFSVDNSVRLDNNAYLNRTFSGGTQTKFTLSAWIKRSAISTQQTIMSRYVNANKYVKILINNANQLEYGVYNSNAGGYQARYETSALFRDTSAWYHIVIAQDSSLGTAADRVKFYVNGELITSFGTNTQIGQNVTGDFNGSGSHQIGAYNGGDEFQGYFSQICFVDNAQYNPTSFAEFDEDSGIWKPIDVSGLTFGTNGFYLDFENSGALGADVSGNTNNFTVNNLTAIDQSTDTCTNNFATANSIGSQRIGGGAIRPTVYSEGNLRVLLGSSEYYTRATSTIAVSTGKWYWETKMISNCDSGSDPTIGIIGTDGNQNAQTGTSPNSSMQYRYTGQKGYNDVGNASYGATWTNGDIIGIALDLTSATKTITFYKNNSSQGVAFSGNGTSDGFNPASQYWSPFWVAGGSTNATMDINFGNPIFTGTDQTDGNGYGSFEYEPPSGYYALNTKNLAEYG